MSGEMVAEWASTTLKEAAAELFTDGDWVESKDQDPDGEVRLIQLADIGDGSFLNKSAVHVAPTRRFADSAHG
jgi:type I restriction enzyme S subunit